MKALGKFGRRAAPAGSRRRRWLFVTTPLLVAAGMAIFVVSALAVTGSPSGFESGDGNMVLNNTDGSHTDWNCFLGSGGFQPATPGTPNPNCKVTTGATHAVADTNGEITWVNGQKFDTKCPQLKPGSVPNKDDFTHVAEFQEFDSSGNLFFYGGAIRQTANGNASGDVEFNQAKGDGTTTAGCRTAGDRLIAYDFLNGGTTLDFHALTWIDSTNPTVGGNIGTCLVKTDSMPCWGANSIDVAPGEFDGEANQSAIAATDNGISGQALALQQFSEFGINLTQALGGGKLPCFPQQVWESRSSGSSFTSNPEDIEFVNLSTCGNITIIKHTAPRGLDQSFNYSTTGGLSPSSFSLNDKGNSTGDSAGNTQQYQQQATGTYTVTEGSDPTGFAFDHVSCTGGTTSVSGRTVTINLAANDNVVCTYVNNQQLGAIKVTKTSIKGTALAGAKFSVTGPNNFSTTLTSGADGTACVDHLPYGDYSVTETAAPSGYSIDDSSTHTATVGTNTTCAGTPSVSLPFTDTPLTDISAHAKSEATGGTQSQITCKDANGNTVASSGANMSDPADASKNGVTPGTYTCVIVVDP
jgi:hypothetical protein